MDYSRYNLNTTHPLIPNENTYLYEKKYVSITSQDRDILKYPNPSNFEIELPQDYVNVKSVRLAQWSFPSNYNVFSVTAQNVGLVFKITYAYNPTDYGVADPLTNAIYAGIVSNYGKDYIFEIEPGFYNPLQMATELTNKFNEAVTKYLIQYFTNTPPYPNALRDLINAGGYQEFVIAYNSVQQKLFFGNRSAEFILQNDSIVYQIDEITRRASCRFDPNEIPSFVNWGLPFFLGFSRCPSTSSAATDVTEYRFYYGSALTIGDNGIWITPSLPNTPVAPVTTPPSIYFLVAPLKINFMGPPYFYMELNSNVSLNCIDETSPFSASTFTLQTNQTNGIVNSAFAKIAIPTTPISQWYDNDMIPYKWFDPPAERIRRLNIKLRYHNGILVDFGSYEWSILLEFTLLRPQIPRKLTHTRV
jgi:hypothetical protein